MKVFWIFLALVFISCVGSVQPNQKLIAALTDEKIAIRGSLNKIDHEFRLDYYDVYEDDTHYEFLESKGYQGGGPSWYGIIYGAIKLSDPSILSGVRFDIEGEGLAMWSTDKVKLQKIGRLISTIKSDQIILMKSIYIAEKNWKME